MIDYALGNAIIFDARDDFPDLSDPSKYQFNKRDLGVIDAIVIHHWASGEPATGLLGQRGQIQGIYAQWTQDDGVHNTVGFPYHFAIFPNGNAYYVGDISTARACVARENFHVICVSLPGNYNDAAPSDAHIERIKEVTDNIRYVMGTKLPIVGHKDLTQTECPGFTWDYWKRRLDP